MLGDSKSPGPQCGRSRFLVTGGAGFVGSHLVEALLKEDHEVRVLDDLSSGHMDNLSRTAEFVKGDVVDPTAVAQAFDRIDGCFHLAAIASVMRSHCEWVRTHQVNLSGTINVLDQARRCGRAIPVVHASTAAVYGNCGTAPLTEGSPTAPLSGYGADKLGCEFHARVAGAVHGVPTVGLRFFNLYGPRQNPLSPYAGVITIFANRLLRGEDVEVFGDGSQTRDFTDIGDAVDAMRRAMVAASTSAPIYNVCTGKGTTIMRLAEMIAACCGTPLIILRRAPRAGDVHISIGNPRDAAEKLGFRAETTLKDGLAITLDTLKC
jgi:UDP-glucose 4-epimerase